MIWVGIAAGLFVLYRLGHFVWWYRQKKSARNARIEAAFEAWQKAHPRERIPVDTMLKIAHDNWEPKVQP